MLKTYVVAGLALLASANVLAEEVNVYSAREEQLINKTRVAQDVLCEILDKRGFDFKKLEIELNIVGTDLNWWDKSSYYKEKKAIKAAFTELIKIPYNFIKYGLLYIEENL